MNNLSECSRCFLTHSYHRRWPSIPRATASKGSGCFPISVHCRSLAEAEKVWKLQDIVEVVEAYPKHKVAAAFLMSVVARNMFKEDKTATFYAAFWDVFERPILYFSW